MGHLSATENIYCVTTNIYLVPTVYQTLFWAFGLVNSEQTKILTHIEPPFLQREGDNKQ